MVWRTLKQGHSVKENHFFNYFLSRSPPNLDFSSHYVVRDSVFNCNGTVQDKGTVDQPSSDHLLPLTILKDAFEKF